jgi:hypothetical protein
LGAACSWETVLIPNASESDNDLAGVTAIAPDDAWAVGSWWTNDGTQRHTLIEHWDGVQWSIAVNPFNGPYEWLADVSAVSSRDVWAVGAIQAFLTTTIVEHWDGDAWTLVPSPNASEASYLYGVAALAADDVWAVGQQVTGPTGHPLIEHWDGTAWSIVDLPAVGPSILIAVAGTSASDVWAVGAAQNRALALHYDGSAWSVVPIPDVRLEPNALFGVTASSASSAWAVGSGLNGTVSYPIAFQWDGTEWRSTPRVPSPSNGQGGILMDVAAVGGDAAVVVGTSSAHFRARLYDWSGDGWDHVPQAASTRELDGVDATSASDVWAVGVEQPFEKRRTFAEHCGA